jgi:hypothetical protein
MPPETISCDPGIRTCPKETRISPAPGVPLTRMSHRLTRFCSRRTGARADWRRPITGPGRMCCKTCLKPMAPVQESLAGMPLVEIDEPLHEIKPLGKLGIIGVGLGGQEASGYHFGNAAGLAHRILGPVGQALVIL